MELEILSGKKRKIDGYRQLAVGEIIKQGDYYRSRYDGKLYLSHDIGCQVGIKNRTSGQYYRAI